MSESLAHTAVLSREELGALLETMADSARQERARQGGRPLGISQAVGSRGELLHIAKAFAEEQGRSLSTLHQTSISIHFSQWEEIGLRDFADAMLADDRVARVHLGGGHDEAFFLINRPLLFGWMMLAFGAKPDVGSTVIPDRPYTRIEERFLRRANAEIGYTLARSVGSLRADEVSVTSLDAPAMLQDRAQRPYLVASFEVGGVGELCRFHLAIPTSVVEGGRGEAQSEEPRERSDLEKELLDVAVDVRVEVGGAELSLSQVADLRPGSEIPLEAIAGGELIVRIGNTAKFRAERGSGDQKLAVRILEAL